MNYANEKVELESAQINEHDLVTALTAEQLDLIAGGECVVNQL